MLDDPVLLEMRGQTAVVTLNRPHVHNALGKRTRQMLYRVLRELDDVPEVRVVILTGTGASFCSGRDLAEAALGIGSYDGRSEEADAFNRRSISKPVIAAVHGNARGGGLELALACDLIVAARGTRLGLPEVSRNLVATGGGLLRLLRRIPHAVAVEMALSGRFATADELDKWGLFASLVDESELLNEALALADRIAVAGPSAVRATKEILKVASVWGDSELSFDAQAAIVAWARTSPDREEGIRAFLEKRIPEWTDL